MLFPVFYKFLVFRIFIVEKYDFCHILADNGEDKQAVKSAKYLFGFDGFELAGFDIFEHNAINGFQEFVYV